MKPHPRIRKTVKWGGLIALMALVCVGVRSAYVADGFNWAHGNIHFEAGALRVSHFERAWSEHGFDSVELAFTPVPPEWRWQSRSRSGNRLWVVPLWMPAVIVLGLTSAAWVLDIRAKRRFRAGHCPRCGYDRSDLPGGSSAVCPECGAGPPTPPAAR